MPELDATTSPVRAALDRLQDLDMTGVPEAEQIQRLTVQRDQARSEVQRLEHLLHGLRSLNIEAPTDEGGWRARATLGGAAVRELAALLADWFRASGGVNFVAVTVRDPRTGDEYELVMQRKAGRTPSDLLGEALGRVRALRAALECSLNSTSSLEQVREVARAALVADAAPPTA